MLEIASLFECYELSILSILCCFIFTIMKDFAMDSPLTKHSIIVFREKQKRDSASMTEATIESLSSQIHRYQGFVFVIMTSQEDI